MFEREISWHRSIGRSVEKEKIKWGVGGKELDGNQWGIGVKGIPVHLVV